MTPDEHRAEAETMLAKAEGAPLGEWNTTTALLAAVAHALLAQQPAGPARPVGGEPRTWNVGDPEPDRNAVWKDNSDTEYPYLMYRETGDHDGWGWCESVTGEDFEDPEPWRRILHEVPLVEVLPDA